jgi:hypothetical protein
VPDELKSEPTDQMRLARAGIAEHQDIGRLIQECP